MSKLKKIILIFCATSILIAQDYNQEIKEWDQKRIESLKKNWVSLIDLHWLSEGENSIGSEKDSDLILTKHFPKHLGAFLVKENHVQFITNVDGVYNEKIAIRNIEIFSPDKTITLTYKSLTWFIILRSGKLAVRIRDDEIKEVKDFSGIERFPVNIKWKISATFVPYNPPKIIKIINIIGLSEEEKSSGKLVFFINDKEYQLDTVPSGDSFFIMFKDSTNGHQTYSVGRYMHADKPDKNNKVLLDFNKAYNPPCGYTYYATCPLVPKQNHLPVDIVAGEKYAKNHH